jgi:integrase
MVWGELLEDWVTHRVADAPTSWDALTTWFAERGSPNAGPRTRRESVTTFKLFKELCPELLDHWRTLTVDEARLFQVRVGQKREPATVVKHLANLRKLWNACKKSWVRENPWAQLTFPKVGADPESWHYFPAIEVARLIAAADEVWKARIRLAWKAGLRPGEIDHLRVADVDWTGARVHVRRHRPNQVTIDWDPKDKDSRTIPIDEDTLQALRKLKARCGRNPYLMVRPSRWKQALAKQRKNQWRQDLALINGKKKVWDRLLRAAKISDHDGSPEFYSLRKTCCCDMLDGGAASHEVQAMMGHAELKTTMTWYAKVNKAAAERRIRDAQSRAV